MKKEQPQSPGDPAITQDPDVPALNENEIYELIGRQTVTITAHRRAVSVLAKSNERLQARIQELMKGKGN